MNWEYSCGAIVFTRQNGQIPYEQAVNLFEHENTRRIFAAAHEFLTK